MIAARTCATVRTIRTRLFARQARGAIRAIHAHQTRAALFSTAGQLSTRHAGIFVHGWLRARRTWLASVAIAKVTGWTRRAGVAETNLTQRALQALRSIRAVESVCPNARGACRPPQVYFEAWLAQVTRQPGLAVRVEAYGCTGFALRGSQWSHWARSVRAVLALRTVWAHCANALHAARGALVFVWLIARLARNARSPVRALGAAGTKLAPGIVGVGLAPSRALVAANPRS